MAPSIETIVTLRHLHPSVEVDLLPPFVNDFDPEMDLILDRKAFIFALMCSPSLSFGNPSGMVYELLQDCFVLDDSTSGFDLFLKICEYIAHGHVPPLVSLLFVTS
jgi:hypothetical protein